MRQARYWIILLPLFLVLTCVGAYAQANSEVTGIVTDQTGAVVAGANITLLDPATGFTRTTVSSGAGLYGISGLNPAFYNLKVTAKGFQTYLQSGVVVNVSGTFRVDVKLTIGVETQTVTVTADALTVQTDSNVISTLISGQQITEIATNGRNLIALAELGLGASSNNPDLNLPSTTGASASISFNGLDIAHNIWYLDGAEAYDRGSGGKMALMPSQDAIAEYQVLASNYPPDYGISSGGTVTISLKSGTQKFHGEGYEFIRNDAFQGHNYFDGGHKSELRYDVYGVNVGGPLFIPHVYNSSKKKTFFFASIEWRKLVTGQAPGTYHGIPAADAPTTAAAMTYVIPQYNTASQVSAPIGSQIFYPQVAASSLLGQKLIGLGATTYTPTAPGSVLTIAPRQAFAGNIVPAVLLDPNAILFNKTGNFPTVANNSTTSKWSTTGGHLPTPIRDDIIRIDHNFNDKWSILGHFIHDQSVISYGTTLWAGDNMPTVGSSFSNPSFGSVIKLTGQLTPSVLLEAAFNYDGNKINLLPVPALGGSIVQPTGWGPPAANTGTAGGGGTNTMSYFPAANNAGNRVPNMQLGTNGMNVGAYGEPWTNGAEDYNEVFGLSVTKGRHALKFGGGYNRYTKNQITGASTEGTYTFGDGWNGPCPAAGCAANYVPLTPSSTLTGDSQLDFDLGLATSYGQSQTDPIFHYVNNTLSAYAMDNWHANSQLSVQIGLRYDALPHVWERQNRLSNFDPSQYQTAMAPTFQANGAFCTAVSVACPGGASAGLQTFTGANGENGTFYMNGVVLAGQGGTPRGMVKNWWKTYQPRVGFSYDVRGNGKTIVRGGFGTFFERIQGNDIYDIAGNAPFVNSPSASNVELSSTSYNWQSGTASTTPVFTAGPTVMNTYYPDPAVAMFSLGVQHEILPSLIWVTQYVGNVQYHQNIRVNINNFPLSTSMADRQASAGGTLSTVTTLMDRTYPGFGGMNQITNSATGTYNGLQTGIRQQDRHGLSFEVNYTWSHAIDDRLGSSDLNCCASNPWNIKYDKGSGSLDRRQILNINYTYKLPIFAHDTGVKHDVIGGWVLAGTAIWETGLPWAGNNAPTGNYGDTVGLGGGYSNRADRVPGSTITYSKTHGATPYWMNNNNKAGGSAAAFQAPVAAWNGGANLGFGNMGRDAVVGPGRTNFNTSLYKTFAFGRFARIELRAESYNTFNHTQFAVGSGSGGIQTNTSAADYGAISKAADPRTFQFGGKIIF
jgi:hypothetical protein